MIIAGVVVFMSTVRPSSPRRSRPWSIRLRRRRQRLSHRLPRRVRRLRWLRPQFGPDRLLGSDAGAIGNAEMRSPSMMLFRGANLMFGTPFRGRLATLARQSACPVLAWGSSSAPINRVRRLSKPDVPNFQPPVIFLPSLLAFFGHDYPTSAGTQNKIDL
jgi:hypothetical protein